MRDPLREAFDKYRSGEPFLPAAGFLLRWGLGFVFLWFGIDKFVHPGYWPMWIPSYLPALRTPAAIAAFGIFEVLVGLALVVNVRVREASAAAAVFLAGIIATNGLSAVVRDVGLLAAALYLALTTRAPAAASSRAARASRGWTGPVQSRTVLAVVVGFLVFVGVVAAAVQLAGTPAASPVTGPFLVIETPAEGSQLARGDLLVTARVVAGEGAPLANHVHFKVDAAVIDAVYLRAGEATAATTLKGLAPGTHTIEAYLAYADHVEHPGSRAAVTVTVTG